ncbi:MULTISPECIES: LysE family translocator [unclassified Halomonas]|uniref:LysE family translocator n=1 Tax=unclassified Halomonas TaxID=2609666 RepID=UPI00207693E0|nr:MULTISPECIES: LysE family translocator [unclassified Halomonas]
MSVSLLLPMSAFALAASISPGPVNLVCMSSGIHYRVARGLVFVTGATLGFIALFLSVGAGLYSLLSLWPALEVLLRWAGVAFLLYLSARLALDNGRLAQNFNARAPGFLTGAVMQWLNPKAWLASASGISAYAGANAEHTLLFAALYLPICWLSLSCWVFAGAFLKRYVANPTLLVVINRVLALLLAVSCLFIVLD